jgi:hypothetical protein
MMKDLSWCRLPKPSAIKEHSWPSQTFFTYPFVAATGFKLEDGEKGQGFRRR